MLNQKGFAALTLTLGTVATIGMIYAGIILLSSASNRRTIGLMDNEEGFYAAELAAAHSYVMNQCDAIAPEGVTDLHPMDPGRGLASGTMPDMSGYTGTPVPLSTTAFFATEGNVFSRRLNTTGVRASLKFNPATNTYCGLIQNRPNQPPKRVCITGDAPPASGSTDPTFGTGGSSSLNSAVGAEFLAMKLLLQPDGKIIAIGYTWVNMYIGQGHVIRYNQDGSRDTSFAVAPLVVPSQPSNVLSDGTILPDGKILVSGNTFPGPGLLARYNTDGTLDPTFGTNGYVDFNTVPALRLTVVHSLTPQPDGKIILTDQPSHTIMAPYAIGTSLMGAIRLNSDGSIDTGFGLSGFARWNFLNISESATISSIQPDGKILVSGSVELVMPDYSNGPFHAWDSRSTAFGTARLNPDGSLDTTFNGTGKVLTTIGPGMAVPSTVVLQPDGKILLGGQGRGGTGGKAASMLVRYLPDGSPDVFFGSGGVVATIFNCSHEMFTVDIRIANSKITTLVNLINGAQYSFGVAEYTMAGTLTNAFARQNGKETFAVLPAWDAAFDANGKIVSVNINEDSTNLIYSSYVSRMIP